MPILIALLIAAAPSMALKIQREAEDRARAEVADLLRTICPEQCVLLSVRAQTDDEDVSGEVSPGFDAPGNRTVPVLRLLNASVLVDQRLPAAFRTRVKSLVGERLKTQGVPAEVALQQVNFPVRNPPHLEAPPQQPVAPPAPKVDPPPAVAAAIPVPPVRLQDKLMEHAPLLAVVALLGGVLLALGGLFYLAARKPQETFLPEGPPLDAPPQQQPAVESPSSRDPFPESRARRLEKQLADDRALRNEVVREALGRGEHAVVARWVRELGEFLLEDLRGDGALARGLAGVASEVAKSFDSATRAAALQDLEGRVLASRLARTSDADAFAFLEGVRVEVFLAAWRSISSGAQEVALRLAPPHLRAAALKELPAEQRQTIAVAWVRKPEVSSAYALAAADELRGRLADLHSGPAEADRALADLLDSLTRDEQDALIDDLRREGDPRALSGLLTESALAHAPSDLLGSALLGVAPRSLVAYLAGADTVLRAHLLSAAPPSLRKDLEEELTLRPGTARDDFLAARRDVLARMREETMRRGLKPVDVRSWRPRMVQAP